MLVNSHWFLAPSTCLPALLRRSGYAKAQQADKKQATSNAPSPKRFGVGDQKLITPDPMKTLLFLFSFIAASTAFAQSGWQTYPYSPLSSVLSFPADDGYHPDPATKTEWWYINLHLIGSAPQYKKYDVMLVYFRFANMRIFNISESSGTFHSNVLQAFPTLTFQLGKWDLTYTVPFQISDYSK